MSRMMKVQQLREVRMHLYTTGELAQYFQVTITTIHNWIKSGYIHATRMNEPRGRYYISQQEVEYIEREFKNLALADTHMRRIMPRVLYQIKHDIKIR